MNSRITYLIALIILLQPLHTAFAQDNDNDLEPSELRSSFDLRRKSDLDANRLRATYQNFGLAGSERGEIADNFIFEFPKNTERKYMFFVSIFMGAEVTNQQDGSVLRIVDSPNGRTGPNGESFDLNPIEGYTAPGTDEIARSDQPQTWPSTWPDKPASWNGSWNGLFGRDVFNADQEFFYRSGDDLYTRFSSDGRFRPDKTDPSRGGLGLILNARVLAWTQVLIRDVNFMILGVENDASFDYDKVAFTLWVADWVGTPSNDRPIFDERRAVAFLTDETPTNAPPEFEDEAIGALSMRFLETPGNPADGIDNDGDADLHNINDTKGIRPPDSDAADLIQYLVEDNGGFYESREQVLDEVIPSFTDADFQPRNLQEGDKIVLIDDNDNRIVTTYPEGGGTVVSQGREIELPAGGTTLIEEFPEDDPNSLLPFDLIDNDLDGLIDESQPNHKDQETAVFQGGNQIFAPVPVRFINYLNFEVGDTLQRGLVVPNSDIRARIESDEDFAEVVLEDFEGRFQNKFTSAAMIDESSSDRFDNDQDWLLASSDVGLDGRDGTGDEGEGDGLPTSGAFTNFPGEPNIDKTDVTETDFIGITAVTFPASGSLGNGINFARDERFFRNQRPGVFEDGATAEDSDILITSSFFPLDRGTTQSFALAITVAQTDRSNSPIVSGDNANLQHPDIQRNLEKLDQANKAFEADYQFATAPDPPKVTAVPGDKQVTLYWDESAEDSFDRFLDLQTGQGFDFEGYRIYRSTDPSLGDIGVTTDGNGNPVFLQPIAIFDKDNGFSGLHPIDVNGANFNLGDNTGLVHKFTDEGLTNGQRYFYIVNSYDFGSVEAGITPSESRSQLNQQSDGTINTGPNVVVLRPSQATAGFISADNPQARLVRGSAGGNVLVNIVDPDSVKQGNIYNVVFEDTLVQGRNSAGDIAPSVPDTLKTKNFSLVDVTSGVDTLLAKRTSFNGGDNPVVDGFRLSVQNQGRLRVNNELSEWKTDGEDNIHEFRFQAFSTNRKPADYKVIIDEIGFGRSIDTTVTISGFNIPLPAKDVNFKVRNTTSGEDVRFAFADIDSNSPETTGRFTARVVFNANGDPIRFDTDQIIIFEEFAGQPNIPTWQITMFPQDTDEITTRNPAAGDTLDIKTVKPFTSNDVFEFEMMEENTARVNPDTAKNELDNVFVFPNPYRVSNPLELPTTESRPQQNRELHFRNVPAKCTIRIFDVSGFLVDTIEVDNNISDGNVIWDMQTKDELELAYGVYLYHIKAPGIGETTGKFAVIK